jgi:hypothetical protein
VTDRLGNALAVGDDVMLAAKLLHVAAGKAVVDVRGNALVLDEARLLLASQVDAAIARARSIWPRISPVIDARRNFAGVATATTGSGVSFFTGRAQWLTQTQQAGFHTCFQANSSLNTSGVHAGSICGAPRGAWHLYDGTRWFFRFDLNVANRFSVMRLGFWGNDPATPIATTGRPSHGLWMEYDPATLANSNWWLCCANGGAVSVADTGLAITTSLERPMLFDFVSTSLAKLWLLSTGAPSQVAQLTTNLPNTWTARVGVPFVHLLSANTGSYGHFLLKEAGPLDETHPQLLLPE